MFGSFVLAGVLVQIAWAGKATERAQEAQCADNTNCAAEACNVLIGGKLYCSRCNTGFVPINGQCADKEGATDKCKDGSGGDTADQTCGQCAEQTFMYKGGCYEAAQQPGQTMCQAADAGVCTQAAQGYFVPPGADASHQSVIPCGDEEEITVKNDKKYKGVLHCTRCNAPTEAADANAKAATCTACQADRYLKTAKDQATSCVTEQECTGTEGFFAKNGGTKTCEACAETCKTCKTEAAKCTSCKDDKPYLKKDNGSDTGTCVTEAECKTGNTHYPDDTEPKTCKTCAEGTSDGCATCEKGADGAVACKTCGNQKKVQPNKKGCVENCPSNSNDKKTPGTCECVEGYVPEEAGTGCTKKPDPPAAPCNTPGCKTCSEPKTSKEVCTECEDPKALTPTGQCIYGCEHLEGYYEGTSEGGKKACKKCEVENCLLCNENGQCETCKDGYYKKETACAKCDTSCKTCANGEPNGCTSCEAKKALSYEGEGNTGTCKSECKPGTNNCEKCELTVDGTAYCSKCKDANQFPQNGVCSAAAGKAITCTTKGTGVCDKCANGLLRMNGGCYETTKFPGKSVCEEAASAGDTCQVEAPGYHLNNNDLVTCSAGCKTCTSNTVCTECMDGYAKTDNKCTKCATGCATCAGSASNCDTCSTGYYKYKNACVSCTESNSDKTITGVANCANCAPPLNNKGSVLCYLVQSGENTNKSGLSAGAIAGIAVAVIIVVGGLVGFLCWWFMCRGKA
ncbi:VSP with INR [Giardia duodenalis]|uniref:VSP with INR n=2 Tax=Giardia intestinalis TaxID=5741 RepID=E2RU43_GIAIC|nr:VSP with INR [Giardia intestinalis]AAG16629.1 variant-specific surface protein VSP9B10 [Giardia intestinalis]KAE8302587.1 VSP with INR [Giardia intestinalis]|eukprot:XP_001706983.1 VSP with INR [Giardia lamblia ATCC 50803]